MPILGMFIVLLVFFLLGPRLRTPFLLTTVLGTTAEGNENVVEAGQEVTQVILLFIGQSACDHAQL